MKICIISGTYPPNDVGGVAEFTYNLKRYLEKFGDDVYIITSKSVNNLDESIIGLQCGKQKFPLKGLYYSITNRKKFNFDIVHTQHGDNTIGFLPASLIKKIPIITTYHTSPISLGRVITPIKIDDTIIKPLPYEYIFKFLNTPSHAILDMISSIYASKITCVSGFIRDEISKYYKISDNKISVIYNGVDIELFNPYIDEGDTRDIYCKEKYPLILYVGRLRLIKGVYFLIRAMREVVKKHPRAKLMIIGEDEHKEGLIRYSRDLKLQDNIIFIGNIPNRELPKYYSMADIIAVPSIFEALGIVILEAMACGKPVIASNVGGIPELITNGKNGFLFDIDNLKELSDKINLLIEDSSLRNKIGIMARKSAERYDWNIIAKNFRDEYKDVLQK